MVRTRKILRTSLILNFCRRSTWCWWILVDHRSCWWHAERFWPLDVNGWGRGSFDWTSTSVWSRCRFPSTSSQRRMPLLLHHAEPKRRFRQENDRWIEGAGSWKNWWVLRVKESHSEFINPLCFQDLSLNQTSFKTLPACPKLDLEKSCAACSAKLLSTTEMLATFQPSLMKASSSNSSPTGLKSSPLSTKISLAFVSKFTSISLTFKLHSTTHLKRSEIFGYLTWLDF